MSFKPDEIPKANILIVDDSPDNLRILSMTLSQQGYRVRCVTNGEMALVSIHNLPPELILLDVRMPSMDGYEVCRQLKANPMTQRIPIIFLSAADDVADKVKAFEMGGVDYITKPFQTKEVLARIANQLAIQNLQNQLAERNHRLQQEIEQHKKTEAALQDAKAAAEAANYAKSQFIAKISHELRTPLNAILGYTALMQDDPSLLPEYQDYVDSIRKSGEYLLKSINHILTVVRAESHHLSLNRQAFDLFQLVNEIASTWQAQADAKGLNLRVEWDSSLPRCIYADNVKLRQVLVSLIENAIQFTQQGQVILRVKGESQHLESQLVEPQMGVSAIGLAKSCQYGGDRGFVDLSSVDSLNSLDFQALPLLLFFEVEDTGCGVAAHEIDHLFEAFFQAEAGQQSQRGTGLGLFISRQFVQLMGGTITLSSKLAQGTCVRFYVPVHWVQLDSQVGQLCEPIADQGSASQSPRQLGQSSHATTAVMLKALRAEMSMNWFTQLQQAAIQGFDQRVSQLIGQIPASHAPFATLLADWNREFQFDRIVAVTQQVLEQAL